MVDLHRPKGNEKQYMYSCNAQPGQHKACVCDAVLSVHCNYFVGNS